MGPRSDSRRGGVGRRFVYPGLLGIAVLAVFLGTYASNGAQRSELQLAAEFVPLYAAGQIAASGDLIESYDPAVLGAQLEQVARESSDLRWNYPPFALLVAIAFASIPLAISYPLFASFGLASVLAATFGLTRDRAMMWLVPIFPACLVNVAVGQNGAFSLALLGGGCALLRSRPFAAGVVWSGLAFKPQLVLVLPLFLLHQRAWRALGGFTAGIAALILLSLAAGGVGPWLAFLEAGRDLAGAVERGQARLHLMTGVEPTLLSWGVPLAAARVTQIATALVALGLGILTWRRGGRAALASLAPIALLITPYAYFYDLALLTVSALLLKRTSVALLGFVAPMLFAALAFMGYAAAPLASAILLVAAYRQSRTEA